MIKVAVHLIMESTDHYNHLLELESVDQFIPALLEKQGDELNNVYDYYITSNDPETDSQLSVLLRQYFDSIDFV